MLFSFALGGRDGSRFCHLNMLDLCIMPLELSPFCLVICKGEKRVALPVLSVNMLKAFLEGSLCVRTVGGQKLCLSYEGGIVDSD